MATTTIKIKSSSTSGAIPASEDLAVGELAVNLFDKIIYTKQADGTVVKLAENVVLPDLTGVAYLSNDQSFTGSNTFTKPLTTGTINSGGSITADSMITGRSSGGNMLTLLKSDNSVAVTVNTVGDISTVGSISADGTLETQGDVTMDGNCSVDGTITTGGVAVATVEAYATPTVGGVVKIRLDGSDLYITTDGSDA